MALLADLYPQARVICCVREVVWIIDSIERMLRKPTSGLASLQLRTRALRLRTRRDPDALRHRPDRTSLELPARSLVRRVFLSASAPRLQKARLSSGRTMRRLYTALGESPFDHDFSNVANAAAEYDAALGMPGMHTVSQRVEYRERPTCLPPDMLAKYAGLNFGINQSLPKGESYSESKLEREDRADLQRTPCTPLNAASPRRGPGAADGHERPRSAGSRCSTEAKKAFMSHVNDLADEHRCQSASKCNPRLECAPSSGQDIR